MLDSIFFIDVGLSILFSVGYFTIYFLKYRKTPGFLSATLWGIGGYFAANAIYNVALIVIASILGEANWEALLGSSTLIAPFITAFAMACGAVFAAHFIPKMQKRRNKYVEGVTDEVTGFMVGNSFIASPFGQDVSLMYFIQMLMTGIMINSNPALEDLGENITQEIWNEIVALFTSMKLFDNLHLLVFMLVMAYSYMIVFKMIHRLFINNKTVFKIVVPLMITWSFMFIMYAITLLNVASFVKLIIYLVMGAFLWAVNNYIDNQWKTNVEVIVPQ